MIKPFGFFYEKYEKFTKLINDIITNPIQINIASLFYKLVKHNLTKIKLSKSQSLNYFKDGRIPKGNNG